MNAGDRGRHSKVRKAKGGDQCKTTGCGFPLYEIRGDTLAESIEQLRPSLNSPSLPRGIRLGQMPQSTRVYIICPRCDAYALGMELSDPFPIRGADGETTSVAELSELLWEKSK